jgi:CheY-like chemotaxis protein
MIIDDDLDFREALSAVLTYAGYAPVAPAGGLEALRHLASSPLPHLILLDLTQPEMDGRQFVSEQRSRPVLAHIPVALVSAERDLASHAAALGVADYLEKPIKLDDLLATVRRLAGPPDRSG